MLQVIIQALREHGVFSSVIVSAEQTNLSKDEFLSSIESSNSTGTTMSDKGFSSRKIGKIDTQVNGRRLFEFTNDSAQTLAIPPLSPPSIEDFEVLT